MRIILMRHLSLILLLNLQAFSATPPTSALLELFQKRNTTFGEISFQKNGSNEKIKFGPSTGLFAVGFETAPQLLPEPYRTLFKDSEVIQILFCNSKPGETISQFGSILIVTDLMLTDSKTDIAPLIVPGKGAQGFKDSIYIQLRSPKTPANQSGEDELKSSLFSVNGKATLSKRSGTENVRISFSDKALQFNKRSIRLDLNSNLGTPFSPDNASVSGALELSLYSPDAKETALFMKDIIRETIKTPMQSGNDSE